MPSFQSDIPTSLLDFLASIRIVMVNTTLPANIGSAARAMHTMGLTDLVVVSPRHLPNDDAYAHAAGATSILHNIKITDNLSDALKDCHLILATSSRQRHIPKPVLTPSQAANILVDNFLEYQQLSLNNISTLNNSNTNQSHLPWKIAIVFGREDRGLTNEELQLADYHIQIPANPNYGVLNVAAAVQVIASVFYETAEEKLALTPLDEDNNTKHINLLIRQQWDAPAITHEQKQQLEVKVLQLLSQLELYNNEQSKVMPQRISRLLGRLQLDVKEYQLIQAMLAKLLNA